MRWIIRVRDDASERRELLGGLSSIETGSTKGSCASTTEPNAVAGGSFQPPVAWMGGSTGREGIRTDSSRVSKACEKLNGVRKVRCFRRWHKKPKTRMIKTITAEVDAAIVATGTDLFGELEETGTTEGKTV